MVGTTVWCAIVLIVGWNALSAQFHEEADTAFLMERLEHFDELSQLVYLDAKGDLALRSQLSDPRFLVERSGYYWEIESDDGKTLRSPSLEDASLPFSVDFAPRAPSRTAEANGPTGLTRIYQKVVTLSPASRTVRIAVATDLRLLKPLVKNFDATTRRILLFVAIGLSITTLAQAYIGFLPLTRLQRALQKIRSGAETRVPEDFPSELQPAIASLNALLQTNRALIERSNVLAGNLAHSLKTPLSIIVDEATRMRNEPGKGDPDIILLKSERIRGIVDFQLARIRAASACGTALTSLKLAPAVQNVIWALRRLYPERSLIVEEAPPEWVVVCVKQDFEEMLANLVDNALKWANSTVRVSTCRIGQRVEIVVEDDGPGMSALDIQKVFALGARLDENMPGTGFGLTIVKELAATYDGEVWLGASAMGGVCARLSLPAWK